MVSTSCIRAVVIFRSSSPKAPTVGARSSLTKARNRATIPAFLLSQNEQIQTQSERQTGKLSRAHS